MARSRASTPGVDQRAIRAPGPGCHPSHLLFAAGWTLFGIASLRARVFQVAISGLIVTAVSPGSTPCSLGHYADVGPFGTVFHDSPYTIACWSEWHCAHGAPWTRGLAVDRTAFAAPAWDLGGASGADDLDDELMPGPNGRNTLGRC
jgi:hypothetical protein